MFDRIRKLLFLLKLKRELKMKINLTEAIAVLDGLLSAADAFAKMTASPRDDEWVALIKSYREKFRPLFGAEENGGTEDLPQQVADAIDHAFASFEIVADES